MPTHFYNKAMLGLDGRDEQIENYQRTLRNVGARRRADPRVSLHAEFGLADRTARAGARRRAGATKFDMAEVEGKTKRRAAQISCRPRLGGRRRCRCSTSKDGIVTADQMWANYDYFIERGAARSPKRRGSSWRCIRTIRRCRCWAAWRASSRSRTTSSAPGDLNPKSRRLGAGSLPRLLLGNARRQPTTCAR